MSDPSSLQRYRHQMATGFGWLRFVPDIEDEYRLSVRDRLRSAAQICGAVALLVWLGFAGLDVLRLQHLPPGTVTGSALMLWFGARWLVVALIISNLILARRERNLRPWLAWATYVALGLAAAGTGHVLRRIGSFSADSGVIVVVMAAWLPLGFLFWRALLAAVIVAGCTVILSLLAEDPRELAERLQVALMVSMAVPIAAVGGYLREHADRQQFLLASLRYGESMTDALTGLPNRRHLYCEAEIWLARHSPAGTPWAMAVLDLDRFKPFNDHFGHQAGDQALRQVAEALTTALQPRGGFAARLGGEEFCLLLPGAPPEAEAAVRAAQRALLDQAIPHPEAPEGYLSASAGLAPALAGMDTFDALLRRADQALYRAKSSSRGGLRWWQSEGVVGGEGLEPPTFSV